MKSVIANLMSTSALVAALTMPAFAADIPVKAPPPPAPMMWSGVYAGAHLGGTWARERYDATFFPGGVFQGAANINEFTAVGTGSARDGGLLGGVQAGYNLRTGAFLYGLEADLSGLTLRPSRITDGAIVLGPFAGTPFTVTHATHADWLATFRARAGVIVGDTLAYVTGGAALMQLRRTAVFDNETAIPDIGFTAERRRLPGWVVGGGLEYALYGNLSAKAEYLYARFSDSTLGYSFDFEGSALLPNPVKVREQLSLQVARVGLNYHFGNAGVAGAASPALYTKAPMASLQGFSWSGIYAGAHAGWTRTRADFETDVFFGVFQSPVNLARFSADGTGRASADGFTGGGQLGANAQFGWIVAGLEGDISRIKSSVTLSRTSPINPPPSIYTIASTTEAEWLATIRARLGVAFDRSLLYVTAGGAIARLNNTASFVDTTPAPSDSGSDSRTETLGGYVLGGGFEQAFWDRWSIKAEYLHTRLSRGFVDYAISHPGNTGITNRVFVTNDLTLQTARLGVNYRFGGPDVR